MKQSIFEVKENKLLCKDTFELTLVGEAGENIPGQFVEVALPGFTLRRPFGVVDVVGNVLTVLYKVVGQGTKVLASYQKGQTLDVLTELGNGFRLEKSGQSPVLFGGGIGLAPLYYLAKELVTLGKTPTVVLGFRTAAEVFYTKEFEVLGLNVLVATDDGTLGTKGNVITAAEANGLLFDFYYACGPMPMLRALSKLPQEGELSLEARMGCGFGACMGCSVMTTEGARRVCKEGPIFDAKKVVFS